MELAKDQQIPRLIHAPRFPLVPVVTLDAKMVSAENTHAIPKTRTANQNVPNTTVVAYSILMPVS
jgi:hypothetical protein